MMKSICENSVTVNGGVTWPPEFPNHGDGDRLPSDIFALVPSPVPLWCFLPCDLSLSLPSGLVWMVWCRGILALRSSKNRANFLSLLLFLFFFFSFCPSTGQLQFCWVRVRVHWNQGAGRHQSRDGSAAEVIHNTGRYEMCSFLSKWSQNSLDLIYSLLLVPCLCYWQRSSKSRILKHTISQKVLKDVVFQMSSHFSLSFLAYITLYEFHLSFPCSSIITQQLD